MTEEVEGAGLLDSASEVSDHPKGHLTSPNATKGAPVA